MAASDDFLTEARRAGLYDPERDGSTGRAELLQWLRDEHGVTLDEMVEAAERLGLEAIAGDRRIAPGPWLSLEEASARSGMSAERLEDLTIAFGLEPVHDAPDGGVGFRQSEIDAFVLFDGLSDMFSLEEAFALVRVMGSSLSRIASNESMISPSRENTTCAEASCSFSAHLLRKSSHVQLGEMFSL